MIQRGDEELCVISGRVLTGRFADSHPGCSRRRNSKVNGGDLRGRPAVQEEPC
jgi:hypothetical protein